MTTSLRPDYYGSFACLMGGCRLNCCRENWNIPLTREEYAGIRAAAKRRGGELERLCGQALGRGGGGYAHIRHPAGGACPLCSPQGLCRLHAACGPEALGTVCRTFLRSHVLWGSCHRQGCSAACQGMLELLERRTRPIRLETGPFVEDGWTPRLGSLEVTPRQLEQRPLMARLEEIQQACVGLLQRRERPFPQRMLELAAALHGLDAAERAGGPADLTAALQSEAPAAAFPGSLGNALEAAVLFTMIFDHGGTPEEQRFIGAIRGGCGVRLHPGAGGVELRLDQEAYARAASARAALWVERAPYLWEHLTVNGLFTGLLPFGAPEAGVWENTLYFCAVYGVLRFLTAGAALAADPWPATQDALVRGLRKFTHSTELLPRTVDYLRRHGMDTPEGAAALLAL
mgnify:CR=1 FL=1